MAYMRFRIREEDQFKTPFRVPGGQYEFRVGAFGLHGMSSALMRYMHSIFGRPALSFNSAGRARPVGPGAGAPMLGRFRRFVQVYCDDILISSGSKLSCTGSMIRVPRFWIHRLRVRRGP